MPTDYSITEKFGKALAQLLAQKIKTIYPDFHSNAFIDNIENQVIGKTYTQRIVVFAENLKQFLPSNYKKALPILLGIMGEENPNQTGMFTHYYWLLPVGKFIELYGLDDFEISINAIAELTKRNTGEYAIRPYIRKHPEKTLQVMKTWAMSDNFHLRRLASEGLRPKLPWASKLDTFLQNPEPVLEILELLKEDDILFVKKSVANHLTDWIKVNPKAVMPMIERLKLSDNKHTQWIIKRATRILEK